MTTTKTTRTAKETQAISRLRALGKGVRVYCLDQDRTYCVPSPNGDGSAYQVQAGGETMLFSCPLEATVNGAHVVAVTLYREAQEQLGQAHSLPVTVGLHDALGRSLADRWRTCIDESQRRHSLQPGYRTRHMISCGDGRRSQHKRQRALEAGTVRALLPAPSYRITGTAQLSDGHGGAKSHGEPPAEPEPTHKQRDGSF